MTRAIAFLGLALLAVGCGGSKDGRPTTDAGSGQAAGKPAADEAKACIVTYLNQCGWKDVELAQVTDQAEVPAGAKVSGEAWAFAFTAHYTNVFGERQTSANWVAVVARADGKPCVRRCLDEGRRLVGGHTGAEANEKGTLVKHAPAADLPPVVAPAVIQPVNHE
jgi:hypothetical protein